MPLLKKPPGKAETKTLIPSITTKPEIGKACRQYPNQHGNHGQAKDGHQPQLHLQHQAVTHAERQTLQECQQRTKKHHGHAQPVKGIQQKQPGHSRQQQNPESRIAEQQKPPHGGVASGPEPEGKFHADKTGPNGKQGSVCQTAHQEPEHGTGAYNHINEGLKANIP